MQPGEKGRKMKRQLQIGCAIPALILVTLALAGVATLTCQARRPLATERGMVALGSSFAAGAGLGPLQPDSPLACARGTGGYPQILARILRRPLVDMTCGGAVTDHLLNGGQAFQGPQIRAITPQTRLVTVTVGGNDVGYAGDLSLLAARHTDGLFGRAVRLLWSGPKPAEARDFPGLEQRLVRLLAAIHARAPQARIVVATYPAIVPAHGTCPQIGLTEAEAAEMRAVGDQLAATTRAAAAKGGAVLVDMNALGADHHACAATPWIGGWSNGGIAPFHPTALGAEATARAIASALGAHQSE